jgi:hypothetical protein
MIRDTDRHADKTTRHRDSVVFRFLNFMAEDAVTSELLSRIATRKFTGKYQASLWFSGLCYPEKHTGSKGCEQHIEKCLLAPIQGIGN